MNTQRDIKVVITGIDIELLSLVWFILKCWLALCMASGIVVVGFGLLLLLPGMISLSQLPLP